MRLSSQLVVVVEGEMATVWVTLGFLYLNKLLMWSAEAYMSLPMEVDDIPWWVRWVAAELTYWTRPGR